MEIFRNLFIVCTIILFSSLNVNGQSNDDILDQLTDEFSEEVNTTLSDRDAILDDFIKVKTNHHFLYSGLSINNSTPYAGRDYYSGLGNTLPQVFYINTKGWMFGLGVVKYEAPFPVNTSIVLSGGYSFNIGAKKSTRLRFGYSRGTSIDNSEEHEVSTSNTLSSSISLIKPKFISTRVGYSFMVSSNNSHSFSANFYKTIKLKKWNNGNSLEITPDLNFYFSDHEYLADVVVASRSRVGTNYSYEYENTFGLLNAALSLPIEFNIGDFDFTFEYTHNMPRRFSEHEEYSISPSLSFSIGYFLFLK